MGNIANVTAQTRYNTAFEVYGNMVTLKSIKRVTKKKFVGYMRVVYILFSIKDRFISCYRVTNPEKPLYNAV